MSKNINSFKILGIEHIGIALDNSDITSKFLSFLNGIQSMKSEKVEDQGVLTEIFDTSKGKIELLTSISSNSPINNYIDKKKNGIHHIALEVDNIYNAIKDLQEKNIEFIDKEPKVGAENHLIAFIHPKSTGGILFELCQKQNID